MLSARTVVVFVAALSSFIAPLPFARVDIEEAELTGEAQSIAIAFASTLKPKLKKAIQDGGLENAINVCAKQAPEIAKTLSEQTGWQVKRVSLKPRNTANAIPDSYEKLVLGQFEQQQKTATKPSYEHASLTGNSFRYIKAQLVDGICLNCHGQSVQPKVRDIINKTYPQDSAMGYQLGQIRGAISLHKKISK